MKIKHRTLVLLRRISILVLLGSLLGGAWFVYFRTNTFTITSYDIRGVPDDRKTEIEGSLRTVIEDPGYRFFPKNKIASLPRGKLKDTILTLLPNTKRIRIYPSSLHRLTVAVESYAPLYRVSDVQAITTSGIIYQDIRPLDDYPLLVIASSTFTTNVEDGISVMQSNDVREKFLTDLSVFIKKIESVLFAIRRIEIDALGDVILISDSGSMIKITKKSDMNRVWSNLVSAIDTDPLKTRLKTAPDSIEYLDIRFPNKVFYKFKGESFTNKGGNAIIPTYDATTTSQ